ncbi:sigma-70 family RNA polymerase sigma factor [Singulisphaera sp. PoT]|uniref:sigma-70 family RNA polymerase sigma factor n=1 Tax=Singulisphaera sp. PoT TaxID=3411797 RepID=UPI003BF46D03
MYDSARNRPGVVEDYREYLGILTRLNMNSRLRARMDPSDIVQQAILQAHEKRGQFRGTTEGEWLAWLRMILANALAAAGRRLGAQARDPNRERSLEAELMCPSSGPEGLLVADQTSPSEGAMRGEEFVRLGSALARLSDDQRQAVELHYLKGLSVAEVAEWVGRSRPATAGLLYRGLKRLRELLNDPGEASHAP